MHFLYKIIITSLCVIIGFAVMYYFYFKKQKNKKQKTIKSKVIFVLGGPGSGKGTQSELLSKKIGYKHYSCGDLLRIERKRPESPYGTLINEYMMEGKIVPVKITINLMKDVMAKDIKHNNQTGFIFDGFPRNKENLDGWNSIMKNDAILRCVIFLDCNENTMKQRIFHETRKGQKRMDDNDGVLQKRLSVYRNETLPIIEYYVKQNKCIKINSNQSIDEVFNEIITKVNKVR